MKAKDRFEEAKIKLVMKLRGLTREAAIEALRDNKPPAGPEGGEGGNPPTLDDRPLVDKTSLGCGANGDILSAEEFFLA